MINGRVTRVLSDRFMVDTGDNIVFVKSRKKLKREVLPLPGDFVSLEHIGGEYVLSGILPRKNSLIRPPLSNLDQIIITLAPVPQAELLTVDKMLISARQAGISACVCINKTDLANEAFVEKIRSQYTGVADNVISVCAHSGDTEALKELLKGKFSCLAGQSAVGKTSLINQICGLRREVGDMSEKIMRGKNTTVGVELIKIGDNTYVADTPGFAAFNLYGIQPEELTLYYGEFMELSDKCRYRMCTHSDEPDCEIKQAVERGDISAERYSRYLEILNELKQRKTHRKSWRNANEKK